VGHKEDSFCQGFLQGQKFLLEIGANQRVHSTKGLIHEQNVGVHRESPRNPYPLLLPAGKLRGIAVCELRGKPHSGHQFFPAFLALELGDPAQSGNSVDVLSHCLVGKEPAALHDVSDRAAQVHRVALRHTGAIDGDHARGGVHHAIHHPQEGCLPAATGANQDGDGPCGCAHREIFHRNYATGKFFAHGAELNHDQSPQGFRGNQETPVNQPVPVRANPITITPTGHSGNEPVM
jgi:hypothetical protein